MQARTFQEIVAMSGDSTVMSCKFEKGILEIALELYEDDDVVTIYIPTEIIRVDETDFLKASRRRGCLMELKEIQEHLASCHGYCVPSSDFGRMMREVRSGLFLAYGRKASEFPWLLSVRQNLPLIACLVADVGAIQWVFAES